MPSWCGTIYSSGTITDDGNSGWIDMQALIGLMDTRMGTFLAFDRAVLRMIPANLATDETLDLDLNIGYDSAGVGDVKAHDFTQVTATNAAETLVIPGGESANTLQVNAGTDFLAFAPIGAFWKFTWVLGGTTKSMSFAVHGAMVWS